MNTLLEIPTAYMLDAEISRRRHLDFMRYCWRKRDERLIEGLHTKAICARIDKAIQDYKAGLSTYLLIRVPFRHGKSDIASRYLPAHFCGMFPGHEILLCTYGAELSEGFSREVKQIMQGDAYHALYPNVSPYKKSDSVSRWGIEELQTDGTPWIYPEVLHAVGLGGGITGKGFSLGILDDYCKNRLEAESQTWRDRVWDSFRNDFLTRRAPVTIVLVIATPWHVDDIIGRIEEAMDTDPDFPKFDTSLMFPAFSDKYETGVLFPERFSHEWYNEQRAMLGPYDASGLLQCDPAGNEEALIIPEFRKNKSVIVKECECPPYFIPMCAMDIGDSDLTFIIHGYYDFINDLFVIEHEIVMQHPTSQEISDAIKRVESEFYPAHNIQHRFSDTDKILINDLNRMHGLRVHPTRKDNKQAQINALRVATAQVKYHIHPRCEALIKHLERGKWKNSQHTDFERTTQYGHYDGVDTMLYFKRNLVMDNPYPSDAAVALVAGKILSKKQGKNNVTDNDTKELSKAFKRR